jgi:hypothetical protein
MRALNFAITCARYVLALVLSLACLGFAGAARADIQSAAATPGTVQVAVPNGSAITINWVISSRNVGVGPTLTISSNSGTFDIGGTTVGTVNRTISSVIAAAPGNIGVATITETLLVPRNVAFQMANNPNLTATYRRTFSDGTVVTGTGQATLVPSGAGAAEFGIRRLDLAFEDRARVKVLPEGGELFALAEINFDGSGVAQFQWQIADPSSTRGGLVFRTLQVLSRSLSGRARVILRSPLLPTHSQGLHVIRLVTTNPTLAFDAPELRYFVTPRLNATTAPAGQRIGLLGPADGALLTTDIEFSWEETPGAAVYQLEIYPLRSGDPVSPGEVQAIGSELLIDPDELAPRPITGIALPADRSRISLKPYSLAHLEAGRAYFWRIKAIGDNGAVIGASPLRRVAMPQ